MTLLLFISVRIAQNLVYNVKLSLFILLRVFTLRVYHGNVAFFLSCSVALFCDLSLGTPGTVATRRSVASAPAQAWHFAREKVDGAAALIHVSGALRQHW